ncbi:hypothetical protein Mapa_010526 [Marchantia paleacea]|nr:hypothetical protein Mapa_010526 [Marchantia paleacea]
MYNYRHVERFLRVLESCCRRAGLSLSCRLTSRALGVVIGQQTLIMNPMASVSHVLHRFAYISTGISCS